ncbi:TPA: hypothetical protein QCX04_000205 [Bacillus cytotoxicus]|uniref:hypothetical protein n=1 Tax=Bacillus cytotoxicus TaxID=580165 RepID=UPI0015D7EF67|nr:hypothetical protein [Bacillus cytotoxicus]MDH2866483.1 hypothetical protein [Bacillus cytotoxicus]NZD32583.1 hypothetical protein [Bacillus cytotoxicus]NZD32629.1 hypothetical protein [Bacillus cytotoxicus]HDR7211297.1 hypothetical protein [Bacillus cytotoxicus]
MPIYLTEKFADKIDERFSTGALATPGVNNDYEWVGAKTIKITSVNTVPLTDYKRDGASRFGEAKELENELQEMTLTQDKAFTFTIDKMNEEETKMKAGEALARQLREVVIPHIDTYRFAKMAELAGAIVEGNLDAKTVYNAVITATETLDEAEVPENRVIFATPAVIKHLKESEGYVKASELAQSKIVFKGQVAELDDMPVVKVPSKRLGANFIVCHKSATVAPIKLAEYRIHLDPPGISGSLAEGRFYFDAFVLNNKKNAIYVHKKKAVTETKSASKAS